MLESAADGLLPDVDFVRVDGKWEVLNYEDSLDFQNNTRKHKRHNLQGPIDDAFMEPFVCVTGTGTPWSRKHEMWAQASLNLFEQEYDKWLRAEVPVMTDRDVTDEVIKDHNLILFGDPGSNSLLKRVVPGLPVKWTADEFEINGKSYSSDEHGLVLIYPNPLNPRRYVVLNSGHTLHEKDFKASNSWLFPKLGDVAVLRIDTENKGSEPEVEWATLFDSHWRLPASIPASTR